MDEVSAEYDGRVTLRLRRRFAQDDETLWESKGADYGMQCAMIPTLRDEVTHGRAPAAYVA